MTALVTRKVLEACLHNTYHSPHESARAFAIDYLKRKAFSKYVGGEAPSKSSEDAALVKFLRDSTRVLNHKIEPSSFLEEELLNAFKKRVKRFFDTIEIDDFSPSSLHMLGGVGPGASIGAAGTDFLRKLYYGPVSCTSLDVLHSYLTGCRSNPLDLEAALAALRVHGWIRCTGSRISFVAKNVDEARTIATEPSLNMFFQRAIGKVLERHAKKVFGYDKAETPWFNRKSAYEGSVTGKLATIDLSSASDSVSNQLADLVLPDWFNDLIKLYRCEYSKLPDGRVLKLPMVSTMGNGWTFSLMTVLLYSVLYAVLDVVGGTYADYQACSAFGDDLIVPTRFFGATVQLLRVAGFVVNREKSFSEGPFRESCGYDFYNGTFVRPVYVKDLTSDNSLYAAFNRLAEWSCIHNVNIDPVLSHILEKMKDVRCVARYDDYKAGVRTDATFAPRRGRSGLIRYARYQAVAVSYEVADAVGVPIGNVTAKQKRRLEKRKLKRALQQTLDSGDNPDGCVVAVLGGYLRNGRVSERSEKKVNWRLVRCKTFSWDSKKHMNPDLSFTSYTPIPGWDDEAELRFAAVLGRLLKDDR